MINIHKYKRLIKRKTIKSKSEYASKARPNGPLNIYVAGMLRKELDRLKTVSGPHTNAICKRLSEQCIIHCVPKKT